MAKYTKFDPLSNKGASSVLYCIMTTYPVKDEGRIILVRHPNPKDIAQLLGITPPTVIGHLRKLRKIGIIKLGAKFGKFQLYDVNWGEVSRQFFKNSYLNLLEGVKIDTAEMKEAKMKAEHFRKQLQNNAEIQGLLRIYFENLADSIINAGFSRVPTFYDAVVGFEFGLVIHFPQFTDSAKAHSLGRLLALWYDEIREVGSFSTSAFRDAVGEKLKKSS